MASPLQKSAIAVLSTKDDVTPRRVIGVRVPLCAGKSWEPLVIQGKVLIQDGRADCVLARGEYTFGCEDDIFAVLLVGVRPVNDDAVNWVQAPRRSLAKS